RSGAEEPRRDAGHRAAEEPGRDARRRAAEEPPRARRARRHAVGAVPRPTRAPAPPAATVLSPRVVAPSMRARLVARLAVFALVVFIQAFERVEALQPLVVPAARRRAARAFATHVTSPVVNQAASAAIAPAALSMSSSVCRAVNRSRTVGPP